MRHFSAFLCVVAALFAAPLAADAQHEHSAPHGGTLVVLGDEFVHLELVLDPKGGKLTAYVLDGEAERGIAVRQPSLGIEVQPEGGERFALALKPVANVLTGETQGTIPPSFSGRARNASRVSSRFEGRDPFEDSR